MENTVVQFDSDLPATHMRIEYDPADKNSAIEVEAEKPLPAVVENELFWPMILEPTWI